MRDARINKWISRAKINPFLQCERWRRDNVPRACERDIYRARRSVSVTIINFNASVQL